MNKRTILSAMKIFCGLLALAFVGFLAFIAWHERDCAENESYSAFNQDLYVEKTGPDGSKYEINNSAASFGLDVETPDRHCDKVFKSYREALAYGKDSGLAVIPSVQLIQGKCKAFDDGFCATLETAVQNEIPGTAVPGKQETLTRLLGRLLKLLSEVPEENAKPVRVAVVHVATALTLGGAELDLDPNISVSVRKETDNFIQNVPMESKPVGFWTWNDRLRSVFKQDRYLSRGFGIERDTPACVILASTIAEDEELAGAFGKFREFHAKLTNPPVYVDPCLVPAPQAACLSVDEIMAFLPPGIRANAIDSRIMETAKIDIQKRYGKHAGFALIAYSKSREYEMLQKAGLSDQSNMIGSIVQAIRDGRLVLKPGPDSGWYDYQWHALETLLLTEDARESVKLRLSGKYKKRLESAFKTSLTKHRDTHIKNLPIIMAGGFDGPAGSFPKVEIGPEFSAEPMATVYLRNARAYRFLGNAMNAALGGEFLKKLNRKNADRSPIEKDIDTELREMALLCYGIYDLLGTELGLLPNYLPGEMDDRDVASARVVASKWLSSLADDPDIGEDTRFAVPVAQFDNSSIHFAVAGIRFERAKYEYTEEPKVFGPVDPVFKPTHYYLPTDLFFEFERNTPVPFTRDEFRKLCDAHADAKSLRLAFGVTESIHDEGRFSPYWAGVAFLLLIAAPVFFFRHRIRNAGFKRILKIAMPLIVLGMVIFFCVLLFFPGLGVKFLVKYVARANDNFALIIERRLSYATSAPAMSAMRDLLADPNPQVRYLTARILVMMPYSHGDIPARIPGFEQQLRLAADDPVPEVAIYAIIFLSHFNSDENADFLLSKLEEKQQLDNVCANILFSLGRFGTPRIFDKILPFMDDPRSGIRRSVVESLRGFDTLTAQQIRKLYDQTTAIIKPGDYGTAVEIAHHIRRITENMVGQDHPDMAAGLDFSAILHSGLRCFDDAESFYREALAIREKAFGSDHPAVVANMRIVARFLASVGKRSEAEQLYEKALGITVATLGPNHPDTAEILTSLAALYISNMEFAEAETILNTILEKSKRSGMISEACYKPEAMLEKIRLGQNTPFFTDSVAETNCLSLLYDRFLDDGRAGKLLAKLLEINKNEYLIREYDIRETAEKLNDGKCPNFNNEAQAELLYRKKGLHIQVAGYHPEP